MSFWIEMRCAARDTETQAKDCWSKQSEGPMEIANHTNADVLLTLKLLREDARQCGWKLTKEGWICEECAKHRQNDQCPPTQHSA